MTSDHHYLEVLHQRVHVLLAAVPVLASLHPVGGVGWAHVAVAGVLLEQARVQGDLGEQRYQVVVAHLKVKQILFYKIFLDISRKILFLKQMLTLE